MIKDSKKIEKSFKQINQLALQKKPSRSILSIKRIKSSLAILNHENSSFRPYNQDGIPGGLILLNQNIPTFVLPDLHGRRDHLMDLLNLDYKGQKVFNALVEGHLQIVALGDGFHGERRVYSRWQLAQEEYYQGFKSHKAIDQEICDSLCLMEMIMLLKQLCPDSFHFLKGNHENILNEEGDGNHPFSKFTFEGEMFLKWFQKFRGRHFVNLYSKFEKSLPFMACGSYFLLSHAEPAKAYSPWQIINIEGFKKIKLGLTWTKNGEAEENSVLNTLKSFSNVYHRPLRYYFGGHRSIDNNYNLRAKGLYIQFHNPSQKNCLYLPTERPFNIEKDIFNLERRSLKG